MAQLGTRVMIVLRNGFTHTIRLLDQSNPKATFDKLFEGSGFYVENDYDGNPMIKFDVSEVIFARRLSEEEKNPRDGSSIYKKGDWKLATKDSVNA